MENLAWYIIRASFSQERMTYIPEESKVSYQSKDGKDEKVFDALEWLAAMCSHVPNRGEQMARYYGYYSNVSRGKRQKENQDNLIPYILEPVESLQVDRPGGSSKEYRKNWARLIQKIYEVIFLSAQNVRRKIVPLFLSGFPYLVVPLVLQRIQYSAISHNPDHTQQPFQYVLKP